VTEATSSQSPVESWTVQKVLDWTIGHLKSHGCESPRLDAEILLAHARGCQRIRLYTEYDAPLTLEERAKMRELVQRRATLEPVAYLVGFREFFGLDFEVQPGVFIPRPDTETLVITALDIASEIETPRILDVCTGSACIPVSIAANCQASRLTAVELDPQVFEVASRNIQRHEMESRIELLQGDLLAPLSADAKFDVITSNPPYITDSEMESLPPDVRNHEPHLALQAGPDGLDVVRRLIPDANQFLVDGGALLLEIAAEQAEAVVALFEVAGTYEPAQIAHDLGDRSRVVWSRKANVKE
jgi:release factor glutamine methyltransferase